MHNKAMVQQVVMLLDGPAPEFEVRENPLNQAPLSFEDLDSGRRIPRLGSQDILRIAEFALSTGFSVDYLQIADRALTTLPEELAKPVSKRLLRTLKEHGAVAAAVRFQNEWPSYFVTGVFMTTPDNTSLRLLREGVAWNPSNWSVRRFLSDAWRAVRFS